MKHRKPFFVLLALAILSTAAVAIVQFRQVANSARADVLSIPPPCAIPEFEALSPRVIVLSAGLQETLSMLALEEHLVGRTWMCDFPPSVERIPVVQKQDGTVDLALLQALKPDIVIMPRHMADSPLHQALAKLRIEHLGVQSDTLSNYLQSVMSLASRFKVSEEAEAWLAAIEKGASQARKKIEQSVAKAGKTPSVLLVAGRSASDASKLILAGQSSFQHGIFEMLGVKNACNQSGILLEASYAEAAALAPDIIIEVTPPKLAPADLIQKLDAWAATTPTPALRTSSIHILSESWALRTGPRFEEYFSFLPYIVSTWARAVSGTGTKQGI